MEPDREHWVRLSLGQGDHDENIYSTLSGVKLTPTQACELYGMLKQAAKDALIDVLGG